PISPQQVELASSADILARAETVSRNDGCAVCAFEAHCRSDGRKKPQISPTSDNQRGRRAAAADGEVNSRGQGGLGATADGREAPGSLIAQSHLFRHSDCE
ncbi:Hypothetical protein SMAX5B_011269, partial [Scophthalmus maximus]